MLNTQNNCLMLSLHSLSQTVNNECKQLLRFLSFKVFTVFRYIAVMYYIINWLILYCLLNYVFTLPTLLIFLLCLTFDIHLKSLLLPRYNFYNHPLRWRLQFTILHLWHWTLYYTLFKVLLSYNIWCNTNSCNLHK